MPALLETDIPGLPKRRGKVRDVYDLGDGRLLLVATDRISAFDHVLPTGIPDKGRVLTGLADWWFDRLEERGFRRHHRLSTEIDDAGLDLPGEVRESLAGRSMIVKKTEVVPFEFVVRGYLAGSGWKEYRSSGTVCGEPLPEGLVEGERIHPIFTPATKAADGHDENVPTARLVEALAGLPESDLLPGLSITLYLKAARVASDRGLILADTKFEWGVDPATGQFLLIDEVLTPDSSRYWDASSYKPGGPQPSFDKQFVRDWLESTGWDKQSPPPALPDGVVAKTRAKYIDAYEILTGQPFPWK